MNRLIAPVSLAAAVAAVMLSLSACAGADPAGPGTAGNEPGSPGTPGTPDPPSASAAFLCTAQVRTATISCEPSPGSASSVRSSIRLGGQVILGGQGVNVMLESSGTSYDAPTQILRSDVTVQNLIAQPLGSIDWHTLSNGGVYVFFASGPTVTAGSGTVDVDNPDGIEPFTASNQPYFLYPQTIFPTEKSSPREWRFSVPPSVDAFAFTVFVASNVMHESGWVRVAPVAPSLEVGDVVQMTGQVLNVRGASVSGTITWSSSNTAVATVDANGLVTAHAAGSATITASSAGKSGEVTVGVSAAGSAVPPGIDSVALDRYRIRTDGINTLTFTAGVRFPVTPGEITFEMTGPTAGDNRSCSGTLASGTAQDGVYSCAITFPSGSTLGVWTLGTVVAAAPDGYRLLHDDRMVQGGWMPYVKVKGPPS